RSVSTGKASRKWTMPVAIELMWPGVPVTAWATIRPRRSKTPAERSPDSRTMEVNDERMSAAACSLTVAMSRVHRMSSVACSMSAAPLREHVRSVVDSDPGGRAHDDRRFALLDARRPLEGGARAERVAIVDGDVRVPVRVRQVDAADTLPRRGGIARC